MKNYVVVYDHNSRAIAVIPKYQVTSLLKTKIENVLKKEYDLERVVIKNMPLYKDITENKMPIDVEGFVNIINGEETYNYIGYLSICQEF